MRLLITTLALLFLVQNLAQSQTNQTTRTQEIDLFSTEEIFSLTNASTDIVVSRIGEPTTRMPDHDSEDWVYLGNNQTFTLKFTNAASVAKVTWSLTSNGIRRIIGNKISVIDSNISETEKEALIQKAINLGNSTEKQ